MKEGYKKAQANMVHESFLGRIDSAFHEM